MSEQAIDLQRFARIVRRRRKLVGIAAGVGILLGAVFAVLNPPAQTSKAVVVFPNAAASVATQVVVASSNPVLSGALPHISPPVSLQTLHSRVQPKSLTAYLIQISAEGNSAAQAEMTANAVANSYVQYVGSDQNVISVGAKIFQPASTASGTPLVLALIIDALVGAVLGALVGAIVALGTSRRDRQLRARDEIANAIGLPVLASLPVDHPADAAGWTRLLDDYQPGPMPAWWLRYSLKELGLLGDNDHNDRGDAGSSLAIVSLSTDLGALAIGPQLATFAASLGIATALVIGPQQDPAATATATAALRTACGPHGPTSSKRPDLLRTLVMDSDDTHSPRGKSLTIVVLVIDPEAPKYPDSARTRATVLGVSAGRVTAEQLARVGIAAVADGREISGIMVADPEPNDRTGGRVPPRLIRSGPARLVQMPGPSSRDSGLSNRETGPSSREAPLVNDSDQTMIFTAVSDGSPAPATEIRR
jgi:capsular polysaccharide biosynthesis protein